jgi:hypothetical protein
MCTRRRPGRCPFEPEPRKQRAALVVAGLGHSNRELLPSGTANELRAVADVASRHTHMTVEPAGIFPRGGEAFRPLSLEPAMTAAFGRFSPETSLRLFRASG